MNPTPLNRSLTNYPLAKMLADLLEATREAVMVTGPTLRITAANKPAAEAFARYGVPLEGMRLSEVVRDLKLHNAYQAAIEAGKSSDIRLEIGGIQKRKFDVHVGPIEINGDPGAVGFYYDVTQLERLENVRQEFLSNVSHELRTPLTSILAFVETLEDGAIDDEDNNRRFLSVIRRNAERMRVLISDILELSLIESGKVSIEPQRIKLADLVDEVFASLSAAAAAREIGLINEVPLDVEISADVVRKEQMLTNLIDNAIKFNRDAGTVKVSHSREGDTDIITVADTGEGIAPEHLRRIFERFYRVDRARSREIGGTGLGLAIVKHLAKLHGGEVSAESILGGGTKFEIRLPAA